MPKDKMEVRNSEERGTRPLRIPVHKAGRLLAPELPGFVTRFVNDEFGRVDKFIAGGWSLVFDKDISDVDLSTQASQLSSAIRKVANKNPQATVKTCVLMKIPKEMYDEDQAEKQAAHEQEMKAFDLKYRLGLDGISGTINRK